MLFNYETVFILTPVLSEIQMKETVQKFKKLMLDNYQSTCGKTDR